MDQSLTRRGLVFARRQRGWAGSRSGQSYISSSNSGVSGDHHAADSWSVSKRAARRPLASPIAKAAAVPAPQHMTVRQFKLVVAAVAPVLQYSSVQLLVRVRHIIAVADRRAARAVLGLKDRRHFLLVACFDNSNTIQNIPILVELMRVRQLARAQR